MATIFKQCEDWVIASWRNPFQVARFKLTAIYGGILSIIVVGFSVLLYKSISFNIIAIAEEELAGINARYNFIQHALTQVRAEIVLIGVIVVAATTISSYFLARYTLRPIEKAMQAQQKFTENASHELRTPLAIMRSEIEVLLRAENPTKKHVTETLSSAIEEITSLATLAEDLLLLARAERAVFTTEPLNIRDVIERVISMLRVLATERSIILSHNTPAITISGNATALTRIFLNLVHNAITHTAANGSVTVITTETPRHVELRVIDTGVGIKVADQPHIFKRFYKGGHSKGTGLGLAIVAELAQVQGGTVTLESSTAAGTTFLVSFPRT